jgi:hypothetical protein
MIVTPDFLDHWKTLQLADSLSDPAAPLYVLRLWGHCQMRRKNVFEMSPSVLKAVCHFPGDAKKFDSAMRQAGFIRRDGGNLIVHEWEVYNASLFANWRNGKKGGRPPTSKNPQETHGLAMDNPLETHGEPIREEKIREEKNSPAAGASEPSLEDVKTFAESIGLAQWKAEDFFHEMESCGWLDFQHRPVRKWKPLLTRVKTKWEADGRPSGPPKAKAGRQEPTKAGGRQV